MAGRRRSRRKNPSDKATESAGRVRLVLQAEYDLRRGGNDPESAVIDLLSDLRHYCEAVGLDFGYALRVSDGHWDAER